MYTYTEEQALNKNIRQVANDFLYQMNKAFNKDKAYYNEYYWGVENIGRGTKTFVSTSRYNSSKLLVTLDIDDILNYSDINDIDVESATKIILSHEIFHILLGHFSSKYKKHNKEILNLAGDLEINQLIGLRPPGIQPEDFGLKPYRNTDYYYDILIKEFEDRKTALENIISEMNPSEGTPMGINENEEPSENTELNEPSEESNNEKEQSVGENTEEIKTEPKSVTEEVGRGTQSIEEKVLEDMIPEGAMINEVTVEIMDTETIEINENLKDLARVEEVVKKNLSKKDIYNIKGLDEIVRKMVNREKMVKITPHDKVNTYYKFNNRRKRDFILPGKKLTNSGTKKKLDTSLTVFIDVSGSTKGRININLMNVARKMHEMGATIVYYRNSIVSICEPDKTFFTEFGQGGTKITQTVAEYISRGYDLMRAYVFTDGQDDFRYLKEVCEKFNVYVIDSYKVYEKYNEKSRIVSRWH